MKRFFRGVKHFFFPHPNNPPWVKIFPYAMLGLLTILLLAAASWGWEYTNSPNFCGTVCHTMPPQYSTYLVSPHAHVDCVDCHLGRQSFPQQLVSKLGEYRILAAITFKTFEYPIHAARMIPANQACEKCHNPGSFSADSLRKITHYQPDPQNTASTTYLLIKTGGGSKRQGLGKGIHWHTENPVYFYAADELQQNIPYVRVNKPDGTVTEYINPEASFDPASIKPQDLKRIDCITCHNRVTHEVLNPVDTVDLSLQRGLVSAAIPDIKNKAVEVLTAAYSSTDQALVGIASLQVYYQEKYPDFYAKNAGLVNVAITEYQETYINSIFPDQGFTWDSHPSNIGHTNSAGCFRCHDGKHISQQNQVIRLECNLCHSIPVVASATQGISSIEVSQGSEPGSHLNANWILLHKDAFNTSCKTCHTTDDPGGSSNQSFCSNSACHGQKSPFANIDAPAVRARLIEQLKIVAQTPVPVLTEAGGKVTWTSVGNIFQAKCSGCHTKGGSAGLDLSTYQAALKGGGSGPGVVPGSPQQSTVVTRQSGSSPHFGQLTPDELALVTQWIQAGAPEK